MPKKSILKKIAEQQKFDPFSYRDGKGLICGDCGKVLTDESGRVENAYFKDGIRCEDCARKKFPDEFSK